MKEKPFDFKKIKDKIIRTAKGIAEITINNINDELYLL